MQRQADQILADVLSNYPNKSTRGLCLYHKDWHQGVIGILASRVKEKVYLPVIAFANGVEAGTLKGSARSVPGLHIRDTLDVVASRYPTLIDKFGGHAQAAGLQIAAENFASFCTAFDEVVKEQLSADDLVDQLMSDGELTNEDFSLHLASLLREITPWGQHFPQPLFDGVFKVLEQRLISNKHLKLTLSADADSRPLSAIAFNVDLDLWPNEAHEFIQAAYRLDVNTYQGQQNLQLIVEYLEPVTV
jgi:single-stranded-DNA-specific exonuclease